MTKEFNENQNSADKNIDSKTTHVESTMTESASMKSKKAEHPRKQVQRILSEAADILDKVEYKLNFIESSVTAILEADAEEQKKKAMGFSLTMTSIIEDLEKASNGISKGVGLLNQWV